MILILLCTSAGLLLSAWGLDRTEKKESESHDTENIKLAINDTKIVAAAAYTNTARFCQKAGV